MKAEENDMRDTILENAKCLFIEHGYHGLSMREIAEAVGVSKAALYYHFKDKEELFIAVLNRGLDLISQQIDVIEKKSNSNEEKIRQFMEFVLTQPAGQRAVIRLGTQEISQLSQEARKEFDETYHAKFIGKIKTIFINGMLSGEFKEVDPDIATWSLLGIMYPYLYPSHVGSFSLDQEKIQLVINIHLDGIQQHARKE